MSTDYFVRNNNSQFQHSSVLLPFTSNTQTLYLKQYYAINSILYYFGKMLLSK